MAPSSAPAGDFSREVDGVHYSFPAPASAPDTTVELTARLASESEPLSARRVALAAPRARSRYARAMAPKLGLAPERIVGHLVVLLDDYERAAPRAEPHAPVIVPPERRDAAEELLRQPNLLDRAAWTMEALGYVGEEAPRRLVFLVAISRLLEKPLSAILMAPPSSGKSELLEVLVKLMPPEAVRNVSRLTKNALFYAEEDALRHKLLVVDEQQGATEADHSIRLLQSNGRLTLDRVTNGRTDTRVTEGPVALVSGTTSNELNVENLSRCLAITLDDSPEQTRRVHAAQRRLAACEDSRTVALTPWQDAQRLLESATVTIPFAERLRFPARNTWDRREHQKFLTVIRAHALLHQRQRARLGRAVVATVDDYEAVYTLMRPLLATSHDALSARAAHLANKLFAAGVREFSRDEAARVSGTSYSNASRCLKELVEREIARERSRTTPRTYELVAGSLDDPAAVLTPPSELRDGPQAHAPHGTYSLPPLRPEALDF